MPRVRPAGREPGAAATGTSRTDVPLVGGVVLQEGRRPTLVDDLQARGLLFRHVPYEHSYPHCWRCHTPLVYYAQPSWYIRTTAIKDALLARERDDRLVPGDDQVGPLRRLAAQQHRLGALAQPLLGHAPADLALRRRSHLTVRRLAGRARRARRAGPVRASTRTARSSTTSRSTARPVRRGSAPPRARGDRRLVRLRRDAVRAVGLPAPRASRSSSSSATPRTSSARRSTRPAAGSTR